MFYLSGFICDEHFTSLSSMLLYCLDMATLSVSTLLFVWYPMILQFSFHLWHSNTIAIFTVILLISESFINSQIIQFTPALWWVFIISSLVIEVTWNLFQQKTQMIDQLFWVTVTHMTVTTEDCNHGIKTAHKQALPILLTKAQNVNEALSYPHCGYSFHIMFH